MTRRPSLTQPVLVLALVCLASGARPVPAEAAGGQMEVVPGVVFQLTSAVRDNMRAAILKLKHGDNAGVVSIVDALGSLPGELIVRIRDGMFPETLSPKMLKLAALVGQGDCAGARTLFDEVQEEFSQFGSGRLPGTEFGWNGLQDLRQRCRL